MDWNSVAAIAAVAQAVVVAAAGVVALVQIRHLAAQNSLSFLMRMLDVYNSEEFNRSRQYVLNELPNRLQDPAYRKEIAEGRGSTVTHPEYFVINTFNQWGYFASEHIVDEGLLIQTIGPLALVMWIATAPVLALRRTTVPESGYGFEALVVLTRDGAGTRHFDRVRKRMPKRLDPLWQKTAGEVEAELRRLQSPDTPAS